MEDSIYTKDLLLNGLIRKVVFTPLPLYYYYQRSNSATHTKPAAERMPALKCSFARIGTYREEMRNYLWIESTVKLLCSTRQAAQSEKDRKTVSQCNAMTSRLTSQIKKIRHSQSRRELLLLFLQNQHGHTI